MISFDDGEDEAEDEGSRTLTGFFPRFASKRFSSCFNLRISSQLGLSFFSITIAYVAYAAGVSHLDLVEGMGL